jgi:hypothetical protein
MFFTPTTPAAIDEQFHAANQSLRPLVPAYEAFQEHCFSLITNSVPSGTYFDKNIKVCSIV